MNRPKRWMSPFPMNRPKRWMSPFPLISAYPVETIAGLYAVYRLAGSAEVLATALPDIGALFTAIAGLNAVQGAV